MVAGYRLDAIVGRGGMGVVYRATQLDLQRTVALKLIAAELLEDVAARRRFLQESRLAASIDHPHVIPIYAAGEVEGVPYIAMQYVAGDDARTLVRREGRLAPVRAARIVAQVAGALDAAHAVGLVHRDVKPANVLIAVGEHAYLSDFGLSRHVRSISGATATGQWVGTLDYVAPEQIRGGPVDARSDVYALGCLLHYLLTAQIPFPRETDEARLWAHLTEPPPRPSDRGAPVAFDEVIRRALAKSPDDRYPSAGDLGRAAEAAAAGRDSVVPERAVARGDAAPAEEPTRPARPATADRPRKARRRRVIAALLGAAAVAAAAGVAVLLGDDAGGRRTTTATPTPTATTPKPPQVVATVPYGSRPNSVVLAGDRVWVGAWRTGHLAALDATTNRPVRALEPESAGGTVDMVLAGRSLWVATRARQLLELDPATGRSRRDPVPIAMDPAALAVHAGDVYVGEELDTGQARITRYDGRTGQVQASVAAGPDIAGVVYARGRVWTLHGSPNHLVERDPQTLRRTTYIPLPGVTVGALAAGRGALWVTIPDQDQLMRYHLRDGNRATVSVGARPIGIAIHGNRVWVASSGTSTLERVSTRSMRLAGEPIRVPLNPLALAVDDDGVWVTCVGENVVARVET